MTNSELSLRQSQALRGIAILGIVLHNYCHFLKFAVKENEYTFTADKPQQFWDALVSLNHDLFIHFFSFFGHYGVPIFLFISGYGLVKKYEAPLLSPQGGAIPFLWRHFRKLFRLMIWGYLLFVAVYFLRNDNGWEVYSWDRIAAQLTMTVNFLYEHPDRVIKPGPYWFFGLMMQLYALYIFVIHRWRNIWLLLALVVGCWLIQVLMPTPDALNFVRYNFIGGVLPFAAGVALARKSLTPDPSPKGEGRRYIHAPSTASRHITPLFLWGGVGGVAVLVGSFWFHTWLWVPLFVVIGAVATVKLLPEWLLRPCEWVGGISAALFVMHPLMREIIIPHYRHTDIYYGIAVYLLASIAAAMILKRFLQHSSPFRFTSKRSEETTR